MTKDNIPETRRKLVAELSIALGRHVEDFFTALGEFVAAFSEVEIELQFILWRLAGLEQPIGQAVLSGVRTEDAMNRINRLGDALEWTQKHQDRFQHCFSHLGEINRLRNDILHYGAQLKEGYNWRTSNSPFVHVDKKIRTREFSVIDLENATVDLKTLRRYLNELGFGDLMQLKEREKLFPDQPSAWSYKSQQPKGSADKRQKIGRASKPPPRPSRDSRYG